MPHERTTAKPEAEGEMLISRILEAPRTLVWKAMTEPGHLTHWWGPRGFSIQTEGMEFRAGGVWKHTMVGPDGTRYPGESTYLEIKAPEKFVMSHLGGKKGEPAVRHESTWTLEELGPGRTRLTIRHQFESASQMEKVEREHGAREGARQTLERLSEYLPGMAAGA